MISLRLRYSTLNIKDYKQTKLLTVAIQTTSKQAETTTSVNVLLFIIDIVLAAFLVDTIASVDVSL